MSDLVDEALVRVVGSAIREMTGLDARPCPPFEQRANVVAWSWVKVVDPSPGTVVVGMDFSLANHITEICLGDGPGEVMARVEVRDVQAELTNVVAGRLCQDLLKGTGIISLGIPRTGHGMPEIEGSSWVARHFKVNGNWLAIFIQGATLTSPSAALQLREEATKILPASSQQPDATPDQHFVPLPSSQLAPLPAGIPTCIGRYRIIDLLGSGGMGVVFKAHHVSLNRLVALKVMRPDLANDKNFIDRFLREGRVMASLDHRNVVPVYDAGLEDGQLFLAMRFVPGGDLASLLHRSGVLPEDCALTLTVRCLEGLQAIADSGMIHRDIKPANILLESNGVPRLSDLGLARILTAGNEASAPGAPQGTPSYMSPEQARAVLKLDIRSDIYSLGVTLFYMLCGRTPFVGDSAYDIVANVLNEPTPDPRSIRAGISHEAAELVMTAMAKDPAKRFQTPLEFKCAIETVLTARGVGTQVPTAIGARLPLANYWLRKLFG